MQGMQQVAGSIHQINKSVRISLGKCSGMKKHADMSGGEIGDASGSIRVLCT
jgi:hypothetical protein